MGSSRRAMVAALFLAGCGGGGGGGDSAPPTSPPSSANYKLTFTPSTLTATVTGGTSLALSVDAQLDRTIADTVNVAIIDTRGVITPDITLTPLSQTAYRATLFTAPSLAVGNHTGSLEVRLCRDVPTTCASPIPGSPWQLPYNLTVTTAVSPPAPPPAPPPPPPPAATLSASFSPTAVAVDGFEQELPSVVVSATLSGTATTVYPQFVAPSGVFQPNPPVSGSNFAPTATFYFQTGLGAGTYTGNIELRLCQDLQCTSQYPGSPALLPYTVTVRAATNLTPLAAIAGAGDWAMHQGNAGHTGYVPVTLQPARFNRRWKWTAPSEANDTRELSPVVVADGRVVFSTSGYFAASSLTALSEHDRSVQWNYDFGPIFRANPPAIGDGKIFMATSGHSDTFMWSFNASSGTVASKVAFNSQWERYYAPTVSNGAVFTNGGSYGGLLSFKASDGTQNWFAGLPQYDQWTPAVDSSFAYAYMAGKLYAIATATGTTSFEIADPDSQSPSYSVMGAPLLGSANTVVTVNGRTMSPSNRLINFNTASRSIRWSIAGRFLNDPAIANGVIYIANGTQFEARRESDGALQWSWTPPESNTSPFDGEFPSSNVIVTANLAFVSTSSRTYAIDLATRRHVWSYPQAGKLALSRNGVLYIVGTSPNPSNGQLVNTVTAVNLQ